MALSFNIIARLVIVISIDKSRIFYVCFTDVVVYLYCHWEDIYYFCIIFALWCATYYTAVHYTHTQSLCCQMIFASVKETDRKYPNCFLLCERYQTQNTVLHYFSDGLVA